MGIGLQEQVDLYIQTAALFEEVIPCEHSRHDEDTSVHGGNAEWYYDSVCPHCGDTVGLIAGCVPWKSHLDTNPILHCGICKKKANTSEFIKKWIKI